MNLEAQEISVDDRRVFERFSAKLPTRFKDVSDDYGVDVSLRDFSASGARFYTRERFFIDDVLAVEVELPDGKGAVPLHGRVCWARGKPSSLWEVGMEFHKVNFFQLSRLVEFASEVQEVSA
ncbi:MAG: PilZ domain-containing protein [Candidatus Omnitrophota bacterium]